MASHILNQSDDSDSDAPDDVSFSTGRASALQTTKLQREQAGRLKQKQKERRRQLDEQYKEQKKKKLEALANSRFPDELLQNLGDEQAEREEGDDEAEDAEGPTLAGSDGEDRLSDAEGEIKDANSGEEDEEPSGYIPLSSAGGIEVVPVEREMKKSLSSAERAAAFRQSMLYGKHITRESVQQKMAKAMKRSKRKKKH